MTPCEGHVHVEVGSPIDGALKVLLYAYGTFNCFTSVPAIFLGSFPTTDQDNINVSSRSSSKPTTFVPVLNTRSI